jgi:hypothetical protein
MEKEFIYHVICYFPKAHFRAEIGNEIQSCPVNDNRIDCFVLATDADHVKNKINEYVSINNNKAYVLSGMKGTYDFGNKMDIIELKRHNQLFIS